MIQLYPDQLFARQLLFDAFKDGHIRVVFKLPTGGGKTVIAADLAASCLRQSKVMVFVVDSISLIDQTVERFRQFGITQVGVLQADHPATDVTQPIQIASVQTLMRRHRLLQVVGPYKTGPNLMVVDEAHCQYKYLNELMRTWSLVKFIGLTATPFAKGMGKHWDTMVVGGTIRELIDTGRLSNYRAFAASHPDLKGVRVRHGDYVESELSKRMSEGALVSNTVGHWQQHGESRPTLAFCVDRTHAKHVQRQFESSGIPCGYVDAYTKREERQEIADQFHAGDLKVVTSVGCLTKGVDWDVRCILLLRPTKSEMLLIQIIGRGLRVADGKEDCLILDHSDSLLRLGFPEDIDEAFTELDDGNRPERAERVKEEVLPKHCSSCGFLKPAKVHVCPACGFAPTPQHSGDELDLDLEELSRAKRKLNRDTTPEQKACFYAELLWIRKKRGHNPGWTAQKYREKFGVWPNAYKHVLPREASQETLNWVKSRDIAYAKRRSSERKAAAA